MASTSTYFNFHALSDGGKVTMELQVCSGVIIMEVVQLNSV